MQNGMDRTWELTGSCGRSGSVKFRIRNDGASMTEIQRYIVTEDVVVFFNDDFILPNGEEEVFETAGAGAVPGSLPSRHRAHRVACTGQ